MSFKLPYFFQFLRKTSVLTLLYLWVISVTGPTSSYSALRNLACPCISTVAQCPAPSTYESNPSSLLSVEFKRVCTYNGWTGASHWWSSDPISGDASIMVLPCTINRWLLILGGWSHPSSGSSQQWLGGCRTKGYLKTTEIDDIMCWIGSDYVIRDHVRDPIWDPIRVLIL